MKKLFSYLWPHKWLSAGIIVVLIIVVFIVHAATKKPSYQFVTVTRGNITETVTVTGNTSSTQNVSLAFQNGGTIAHVYENLGNHVTAGQTIAALDTSALDAQLAQAQAAVDSAQATLDKLEAGPTSQSIAVAQTGVASAEQTLENAYANVPGTLTDAFGKSNDAIRNQTGPLFTNAETANPQLDFAVTDSNLVNQVQTERLTASVDLNAWQNDITLLTATATSSVYDQMLQNASTRLDYFKQFFASLATALSKSSGISSSQNEIYQTNVIDGSNEVNTANTNVTALVQTIATDKATLAQAEAQLNLTSASSTPQDIEVQQAAIAQAQANVQNIQAQIRNNLIIAPISGTITTQNAVVGQAALPNQSIVAILGNGGFEVDVYVPEVDIGKVAVGNLVVMDFDAFPGETFNGTVFFVNSAETDLSGVVDYLVKISFDKADPRIKSGFTTNCEIQTQTDNNVLILPQYAIIQNDQGTFVETLDSKNNVIQVPVTLGIQDQNGNVEVTSGATEGEQVINIGLK